MNDRSGDCLARSADASSSGRHVHGSQRLRHAKARLADAESIAEVAASLALLGDPGRLRLLIALRDGEMCVSDLAEASVQSESAVSHALRLLRTHRVVSVRRIGRHAFYRLADEHIRSLLDLALEHREHAAPLGLAGGPR